MHTCTDKCKSLSQHHIEKCCDKCEAYFQEENEHRCIRQDCPCHSPEPAEKCAMCRTGAVCDVHEPELAKELEELAKAPTEKRERECVCEKPKEISKSMERVLGKFCGDCGLPVSPEPSEFELRVEENEILGKVDMKIPDELKPDTNKRMGGWEEKYMKWTIAIIAGYLIIAGLAIAYQMGQESQALGDWRHTITGENPCPKDAWLRAMSSSKGIIWTCL